jgi:hypothetical protein
MNSNVTMMRENQGNWQHLANVGRGVRTAPDPFSEVYWRFIGGATPSHSVPSPANYLSIAWGNSIHLHPTPTHGWSCPDGFHVVDSFERNLIRTDVEVPQPSSSNN